jgi:hypothetical protein
VVEGQRAMQFQSDPFLGWTTIEGRDYLVRQLNDHKASVSLAALRSVALLEYAAICGETLARGHARAGDPCRIAGYIGTSARFDEAIVKFAGDYAVQTERDWEALVRSRKEAKPHLVAGPAPLPKPPTRPGVALSLAAASRGKAGPRTKAGRAAKARVHPYAKAAVQRKRSSS